jgi:hypothetical protein
MPALLPKASSIEAGNSLLFLGAGFSAEAINIRDQTIKDVASLVEYLLAEIGIDSMDGYALEAVAEEYHSVHGDVGTAKVLHANFQSKIVTEAQRTVVCQPWFRIYTTNYDDIVERICTEENKSITTKEVGDPVILRCRARHS